VKLLPILTLGAAVASKSTWLVLYPIGGLLIVIRLASRAFASPRCTRVKASQLLSVIALSWLVLALSYGLTGLFRPLGHFTFVSRLLSGSSDGTAGNRFESTVLASLPIAAPADFLLGIDQQQSDFESFHEDWYVAGRWHAMASPWYYYLYALAVKTTSGLLALSFLIIAVVAGCAKGERLSREVRFELLALLLAAGTILVIASLNTRVSHFRYVLPLSGLLLVAVFKGIAPLLRSRWIWRVAALGCLAIAAIESMAVFPFSHSFFNALAGGPGAGPSHLRGTAIEWGQDWPLLVKWVTSNGLGGKVRVLAPFNALYADSAVFEGVTRCLGPTDVLENYSGEARVVCAVSVLPDALAASAVPLRPVEVYGWSWVELVADSSGPFGSKIPTHRAEKP
jgi:hypothetical protein